MIELNNVSKTYTTKTGSVAALKSVNLSVCPGEICGVIGKSGAGKSTLIRCVNLLERPDQGDVAINGQSLLSLSQKELREARHKIGMVFQHFNLLNSRTLFANVAFPLEIMHKSKQEIQATVMPLLELVGLSDRAYAYPNQLSGGQKQRVAIARALATKPMLLLCDEMTSSLDPETTLSILELVKNINTQMNLTILLITHEMDVIKKICDKVAVIDGGKIVEQGKVLQIFREPKHAVTRSLTQAIFHLELPEILAAKIQKNPTEGCYTLLRISFVGESAGQPLITNLVRHYNLQINILQSDLEMVQAQPMGIMLVAAMGTRDEVQQGVFHLKSIGLSVEEVGYVARDDWNFN